MTRLPALDLALDVLETLLMLETASNCECAGELAGALGGALGALDVLEDLEVLDEAEMTVAASSMQLKSITYFSDPMQETESSSFLATLFLDAFF
jgi:hypothetical protein